MKSAPKSNVLVIGHHNKSGKMIIESLKEHFSSVLQFNNYKELLLGYYPEFYSKNRRLLSEVDFTNFIQLTARRGSYYNNYPSLRDEFNLCQDYCLNYLQRNSVCVIYFANIPHEGIDYVLYKIAKLVNIKVVITHQSIFKNRYYISDTIGEYSSVHGKNTSPPITVENFLQQGPSYMKGVAGFSSVSTVITQKIKNLFSRIKRWGGGKKFSFFKHRTLKFIETFRDREYKRLRKQFFIGSVESLSKEYSYIYFPLHMQPELTTSAIGEEYDDQLLAIEYLSNNLPSDFKILVKENPKQSSRYRCANWFRRLLKIERVVLIRGDTSSSELLMKSKGVATISGTAGWESLITGRPVICFGKPWYLSFHGVYSITEDNCISKFLSQSKINKNSLNSDLLALSSYMPIGVVDDYYLKFSNYIDLRENAHNIASEVAGFIK